MPPDGYSTVTISDETFGKLGRLMVRDDHSSYADAITAAVDRTLATDPDDLATDELAEVLAARLGTSETASEEDPA